MSSSPVMSFATMLSLLLVVLSMCCVSPVCAQRSISFKLATNSTPWAGRALTFSTTAYAAVKSAVGFQSQPFIAGGAQSIGLIDDTQGKVATNYLNDVWFAQDPLGQTWQASTLQAPWSARSSGGMVNVVINLANPTLSLQIIVLVGGRQGPSSSDLLNDVWSSLNLGVTWSKLNQSLQQAFSPRENFGLIVAPAFSNSSTRFVYLVGGFGLPTTGGSAVPLNDVYYTAGMGTKPWLSLGQAPFSPRYGMGITNTSSYIFIAGGITTSGATDEVWGLRLRSLTWGLVENRPPASGFVALIQTSIFGSQIYQFSGTDFQKIFNNVSVLGSGTNRGVALQPAYQPSRLQYSTIYSPVPSPTVIILGGIANGASLRDVWYAGVSTTEGEGVTYQADYYEGAYIEVQSADPVDPPPSQPVPNPGQGGGAF